MRYPAFVAEIERADYRPKILTGVFTGYASALVLVVIVTAAMTLGWLNVGPWPYVLIAIKLATNTAAWWAWRTRILYIELSALNIFADVFLMTGALYFTGASFSPLVPIYFLEIAVMALLTNVGLTVLTVVGAFGMYAAMVLMVHAGVLPQTDSPLGVVIAEPPSSGMLAVQLAFVAAVMFAPGAYIAIIVQRLRSGERALEARAHALVEAGRTKSEFTTNVTHELRTPLHGILGVTELLEEQVYGPLTAKQRKALASIGTSARSLLELIDSLLVIARAEALRLEVTRAAVDVPDVVRSVVATGRMLVSDKKLRVETLVVGDLPIITTDRPKLVQILVNLVANAIKFTPDGGEVTVEATPAPAGVRIAVHDTGIGIPEEQLPRVFDPYVQVDGSALREHGGAGIGLAVVRTLAELLDIDVEVDSVLGRGSTFTLHVPLDLPEEAQARTREAR